MRVTYVIKYMLNIISIGDHNELYILNDIHIYNTEFV